MGKTIEKTYDYFDATGRLLFQTVRFKGKTFAQRRPHNNCYVWGISEGWYIPKPVDYHRIQECSHNPNVSPCPNASWFDALAPCLYQLPQLLQGIKDQKTIFICEGEKDAANLSAIGFTATSNPMGAGKWKKDYTAFLTGAPLIVIIADNDDQFEPLGMVDAGLDRDICEVSAQRLIGCAKRVLRFKDKEVGKFAERHVIEGGQGDEMRMHQTFELR